MALDERRARTPSDLGIDEHTQPGHPGAVGVVATRTSIARGLLLYARRRFLTLPSGQVEKGGKALERFQTLAHRPSTISKDHHASSAAAADKLRSWFSGWVCLMEPIGRSVRHRAERLKKYI